MKSSIQGAIGIQAGNDSVVIGFVVVGGDEAAGDVNLTIRQQGNGGDSVSMGIVVAGKERNGGEGGVNRAIGIQANERAVGQEINLHEDATDEDFAVRLQSDGVHERPATGEERWIEVRVKGAVGIQADNPIAAEGIAHFKSVTIAGDEDFAVGLDGDRTDLHGVAHSKGEGGIKGAI